MTEMNLDAQLRKIQGLLAKADSTDSPAEASALRAEAERRMLKYRIEESQLTDENGAHSIAPILREVPLCSFKSNYSANYQTMAAAIVRHVGAQGAYSSAYIEGELHWVLKVVGYESDLRYLDMLYTSARTYFASRMEPTVNPSLSDAENVFALRQAGVERRRIAMMMGWDETAKGTHGPSHAKVTKLYAAECERRGIDAVATGRQFSAKTYREAFAASFNQELNHRLYHARDAAARDYTGGALVLHDRASKVQEEFYAQFPQFRPTEPTEQEKLDLEKLNKRLSKWTKSDQDRYDRLHSSPSARAARSAGQAAAREVDLNIDSKRIES